MGFSTWGVTLKFYFLPFWGVPCCERLSVLEIRSLLASSYFLVEAQSSTQADLLLIFGHITHKEAPLLQNFWADFVYPAWSIHFAGCTKALRNYALVDNLCDIISLDLVVDNCALDREIIDGSLKRLTLGTL